MSLRAMTFADYLDIDAVNWHSLRDLERSPLHYQHALVAEKKDKASWRKGRAAHTAILEPDRFPIDYAVFDGKRRAGKKWTAFKKANEGRTILTATEYATSLAMRDAVRSHPAAAPYLVRGKAEHVIEWTDRTTGIALKGRPDWLSMSPLAAVVDVKTTKDIDQEKFARIAARLGYHVQLALYREGIATLYRRTLPVVFIVVEQDPPHDVGVFPLDEEALLIGLEKAQQLLKVLKLCRETGQWPGKYPEAKTLYLPAWEYSDENDGSGFDFLKDTEEADTNAL
jgi:hypothetical protein